MAILFEGKEVITKCIFMFGHGEGSPTYDVLTKSPDETERQFKRRCDTKYLEDIRKKERPESGSKVYMRYINESSTRKCVFMFGRGEGSSKYDELVKDPDETDRQFERRCDKKYLEDIQKKERPDDSRNVYMKYINESNDDNKVLLLDNNGNMIVINKTSAGTNLYFYDNRGLTNSELAETVIDSMPMTKTIKSSVEGGYVHTKFTVPELIKYLSLNRSTREFE